MVAATKEKPRVKKSGAVAGRPKPAAKNGKPAKAKARPRKSSGEPINRKFAVSFGSISIGDSVVSIGCKLTRDQLDAAEADRLFCGRRLAAKITAHKRGESEAQKAFVNGPQTIGGSFDVSGFGVKPNAFAIKLATKIADVDVETFSHFAKHSGTLAITTVDNLTEEEVAAADDADAKAEDLEGQQRLPGME